MADTIRAGGENMKILMATSEAVPFAKTGGMADVCGALPIELSKLGHSVALIMPAYRSISEAGPAIADTGVTFDIPIGNRNVGVTETLPLAAAGEQAETCQAQQSHR